MANYEYIVDTIKAKEGGLSKSSYDTASSSPSPCAYNNQTGWHTNKGITWRTFVDSSSLGYSPNCENFIEMPDNVWGSIFKRDFWDRYDLDLYDSQAIADFIAYTAFHFGVSGSRKVLVDFFNTIGYSVDGKNTIREAVNKILQDKTKETWLLDNMFTYLENKYKSSSQTGNIQGWLNALEKFKPYAYAQLKPITKEAKEKKKEAEKQIPSRDKKSNKKTLIIVGSITLAIAIGVGVYFYIKKK